LFLNVGKRKIITFSRLRHPIEFPYMLGQMVLEHVPFMIWRLSWIKECVLWNISTVWWVKLLRCSDTLGVFLGSAFYMSMVRSKLEHASCVGAPYYDVHVKNTFEKFSRIFTISPGFLGVSEVSEILPNFEKYLRIIRNFMNIKNNRSIRNFLE
jgi:hypothetical protein